MSIIWSKLAYAYQVEIPDSIGDSDLTTLQDFLDHTQSDGKLSGGVISAHAGPNGTIDISELSGMVHTTEEYGSPIIFFKKAAISGLELNDGVVNYIVATYSEGNITYTAETSRPPVDHNVFVIGRCFRDGNGVGVINSGQNINSQHARMHDRLITKYGAMDHANGSIISEHITPLRLTCTSGTWYFGNTEIHTNEVDQFYVWYKTGGDPTWIKSNIMTLFTDIFDGGTAIIQTSYQNGNSLGINNKYGVFWIFMAPNGYMGIVLGTSAYANIGAAQSAEIPTDLPNQMNDWGTIIGRVICHATATSFYSIESTFTTKFTVSAVVDHGSLVGLGDDDHSQYLLHTATDVSTDSWVINEYNMVSDLDTKVPTQQSVKAYVDAANLDWVPLLTSNDYTIPTNKAFIGGDEFSIEGTDTLSIEGTGRMILIG